MTQLEYRAVLTGDIIDSSRLRPRELDSVRSSLVQGVDVVRGWKRGLVQGRLGFFRGDGWQLLLHDPGMAMRVAVYLRAALRATGQADSRISIGLGEVEKASSQKVSLATGPAFLLSGRGLDEMTQYASMTIKVAESAGALSGWLPVVGHLCDALIAQWTRRQAEIVCTAIDPKEPDYERVGRLLKPAVSKQTVAKSLRGASWYVVRQAIHEFEETPWETVLRARGNEEQK